MLPLVSSASTIDTGADRFLERVDLLLDPVLDDDQIVRVDVEQSPLRLRVMVNSIEARTGGGFGAK